MSIGYLLFIPLALIGVPFMGKGGEWADIFAMTIILWPYPLFLALQTWFPAEGSAAIVAIIFVELLGLALIVVFGSYIQKRFGVTENPRWYSYVWAIVLWPIPLIVLQLVVAAFVGGVLGLPTGE